MILNGKSQIPEILDNYKSELLSSWLQEQLARGIRSDLIKETQLQEECREFLDLLTKASQFGSTNIQAPEWQEVRQMLVDISRIRGQKGFSPTETATFIFSFKQPLFARFTRSFRRK